MVGVKVPRPANPAMSAQLINSGNYGKASGLCVCLGGGRPVMQLGKWALCVGGLFERIVADSAHTGALLSGTWPAGGSPAGSPVSRSWNPACQPACLNPSLNPACLPEPCLPACVVTCLYFFCYC